LNMSSSSFLHNQFNLSNPYDGSIVRFYSSNSGSGFFFFFVFFCLIWFICEYNTFLNIIFLVLVFSVVGCSFLNHSHYTRYGGMGERREWWRWKKNKKGRKRSGEGK
jgi:hypothetical protein